MILEGKTYKFGDDINTDYIIAAKYRGKYSSLRDMLPHLMEDIKPNFYKQMNPGDFIVAGNNFGCGSSREHAPQLVKEAGVGAIIAKSFARIFFRNAINIGLPVLTCNTDLIEDNDCLKVDLERGKIVNRSKGTTIDCSNLPKFILDIIASGGAVNYINLHKRFRI